MTKAHTSLQCLGGALSSWSLFTFLRYMPSDCATWRTINQEGIQDAIWEDVRITPALIATLIDEVRLMRWEYAQSNSKRNLKSYKPKPIERPGVVDDTKQHFGKGAIEVSKFDDWYYRR